MDTEQRQELIRKAKRRNELLSLNRMLSNEELQEVNDLDNELIGRDIFGVMLEEIEYLNTQVLVPKRKTEKWI